MPFVKFASILWTFNESLAYYGVIFYKQPKLNYWNTLPLLLKTHAHKIPCVFFLKITCFLCVLAKLQNSFWGPFSLFSLCSGDPYYAKTDDKLSNLTSLSCSEPELTSTSHPVLRQSAGPCPSPPHSGPSERPCAATGSGWSQAGREPCQSGTSTHGQSGKY